MERLPFIAIFAAMLALLGGINLAVYRFLLGIFPIPDPRMLLAYRALFITLSAGFIGSLFLTHYFNNHFTRIFSAVTSAWMGILMYLFFAACIYWIAGSHFGRTLAAIAVIAGIYGIYNANTLRVTEYEVSLPHMPASWIGKKAVLVSDVHLGQIRSAHFADKVTRKINEVNPDIVLIAGDMFDGVVVDAPAVMAPFKNIKVPLGSYFAMGNHEEFGDNGPYADAIRGAGITILDDEKAVVDGVQILGADYNTTSKKENFMKALEKMDIATSAPAILIKHVPLDLDAAEQAGVSLQVSGHTHRAQMFPFSILTHFIYKGFDYGLKAHGAMQVLTTSGAGTWGPPIRVGTKSEIVVIRFKV